MKVPTNPAKNKRKQKRVMSSGQTHVLPQQPWLLCVAYYDVMSRYMVAPPTFL